MGFESSDFQESKNIDTTSNELLPNTRTRASRLHVVNGPAVSWLLPSSGVCVSKGDELLVSASSPRGIRRVRFFLDGRKLAAGKRGPVHLWSGRLKRVRKGRHVLEAVAVTRHGSGATARLHVRACRK
jgi:hypothetical protein